MRADRLVAALLVLQARGRVTASELAEELEISERTARRDLEALGMAGIPVYSQAGKGGGWSLLGGARTDLSGLTADEARTLFLIAGPSSAATPQMKAALRKLVQALPESFRAGAEAAAAAVVIDPATWDAKPAREPEFLGVLREAVVDARQVVLGYAARDGSPSERIVHPLGLVVKGSVWYLVADTAAGLRTFRVNRVRDVMVTDDPVVKPEGFDLAATWREIADRIDETRAPVRVVAYANPEALGWIRQQFGTRCSIGDARGDGRVRLEVRGHVPRSVAAEFAGFGDHVEVTEPPEVRAHLAEIGAELAARYR